MAIWALVLNFNLVVVPYQLYDNIIRFTLSIPFTLAALLCLWGYQKGDIFRDSKGTSLGPWTVAGLVFWVLFPPTWFFVEFHGVTCGAISGGDRNLVKDYADFASKIWAAFIALYLFTVAQRIKKREEDDKSGSHLPVIASAGPHI